MDIDLSHSALFDVYLAAPVHQNPHLPPVLEDQLSLAQKHSLGFHFEHFCDVERRGEGTIEDPKLVFH